MLFPWLTLSSFSPPPPRTPPTHTPSRSLPHAHQQICLGRYGTDCQLVHRCVSSDTCASLSAQYGIAEQLLQTNNPTLDCAAVYDGLMLCVAPGKVVPDSPQELRTAARGSGSGSGRMRGRARGDQGEESKGGKAAQGEGEEEHAGGKGEEHRHHARPSKTHHRKNLHLHMHSHK